MLDPGTQVKGYGNELVVERALRRSSPFDWYAMREPASDRFCLVQVLPEHFPDISKFRAQWSARAQEWSGVFHAPTSVDYDLDRQVHAMGVYEPFSTAVPPEADPEAVAVALFGALAAMHDKGELLGGLSSNGVAFDPEPRFYDLSVAPLLALAPTLRGQIASGYPHLAPEVRQTGQPSVAGDLYAVAAWLTAVYRDALAESTTLNALLADEGAGATAREVVARLQGVEPESLAPALPQPPPPRADLPEAEHGTAEYGAEEAEVQEEAGTESYERAEVPVEPRPSPAERPAAPPDDVSLPIAYAKLAATLIALVLVSLALARWIVAAYVEPLVPKPEKDRPKSREARARAAFEQRLRRDEGHP